MIPAGFPSITFGAEFFADAAQVQAAIELLGDRLDDFREPLQISLDLVILPSVAQNFAAQGRPRWAALSPNTVLYRPPGPILQVTGALFHATQNRSNWVSTKDSVAMIGIDEVQYAPYHQFGTRKMPARPHVMYQPEDIEKIVQVFEIWIDGVIDQVWAEGR